MTLAATPGLELLPFVFLPRELVLDSGFRQDFRVGGLDAEDDEESFNEDILIKPLEKLLDSLVPFFLLVFSFSDDLWTGLVLGVMSSGLAVGGMPEAEAGLFLFSFWNWWF